MKKNLPFNLLVFCLTVMFQAQVFSQNTFILSGKVEDNTGSPLKLAKVTVQDGESGDTLAYAYTNDDGLYSAILDISIPSGIDNYPGGAGWVGSVYPNPLRVGDAGVVTIPYKSKGVYTNPTLEMYDETGRSVEGNYLSTGTYLYRIKFSEEKVTGFQRFTVIDNGNYSFVLDDLDSGDSKKLKSAKAIPPTYFTRIVQSSPMVDVEALKLFVEKDGYITHENRYDLSSEEGIEINVSLEMAALPTAMFEVTGDLQQGGIVVFDAASSAGSGDEDLKYIWNFDNNLRGGGQKIAHIYTNPGSYDVSLTVVGAYKAKNVYSKSITIADVAAQEDTLEIYGRVFDSIGNPLSDVTVNIKGTDIQTSSDNTGDVSLKEMLPSKNFVLMFTKTGYVTQYQSINIPDDKSTAYFESVLSPSGETQVIDMVEIGVETKSSGGTKLSLPVEGLVDETGSVVTGEIEVSFKEVDVSQESGFFTFPGAYEGVSPDGLEELLLSFGTSNISFEKDGAELQLADGKTADVELPIFVTKHEDGTDIMPGDTIPFWSLNEETGNWTLEGEGKVVNSPDSPTGLAMQITVSHFSWWNCDVAPVPFIPRLYGDPAGSGGDGGGPFDTPPDNPIPMTVTGTPMGTSGPVGGPRNSQVGPEGKILPMPVNADILLTGYANNGTVKGEIVVNGGAGQGGIYIIPLAPLGRGTGGTLYCDSAYDASIDPVGEKDSWDFSGAMGEYVMVTVESSQGSTLQGNAELVAPSGSRTLLGNFSSSTDAKKIIELKESGTYTVMVDGTQNEPGAYRISLTCLKTISTLETHEDTLRGMDKLYGFAAKAGKLYNLAALGQGLSRGFYLYVQDVKGNNITNTYVSRYSETGVFDVPNDGNYVVRLNANGSSGAYTISLNEIESPTPVVVGEKLIINDTIKKMGQQKFYSFDGTLNEAMNFVFEHPGGSNLSAYARIYEPKSETEFYSPKSSAFAIVNTTVSHRIRSVAPQLIDSDKKFIIQIYTYNSSEDISDKTGVFRFTLNKPLLKEIAIDSNVEDTLDTYGFNFYAFSGQADQTVNLAALTDNIANTSYAYVYDNTRTRVKTLSSGNYGETGVFKLNGSDSYFILFFSYDDADGPYMMGLSNTEQPKTVLLGEASTVIQDTIEILGDHHFYQFSGTLNEVLNYVIQHPSGALNAYLRVYEPNGASNFYSIGSQTGTTYTNGSRRIAEIDPGLLGKTSDYVIEIYSYTGGYSEQLGAYQVAINKPTPLPLSLNSNNVFDIPEYGFNVFTFNGLANDVVNLAHLGTTLSSNINLRVYDNLRTYINGSSSAANTFSETGPIMLSGSDTYYVVVNGYLDAAGEYNLGFSALETPTEITLDAETNVFNDTIEILGDHQFMKFSGTLNEALNFVISHPSGSLNSYLRVYEPNSASNFYSISKSVGTTYTNNSTRIREIDPKLLEKTTDYIIEVYGSTGNLNERTGSYQVTVNKPTPVALTLNANHQETMSEYGFNVFTFTGTAEQVVNLAHIGTSLSNNVNVRVYNSLREYIDGSSSAGNTFSETGAFVLTSSNTYYVIVNGYLGTTGDYTLGFAEIETPTDIALDSEINTFQGNIEVLGDHQFMKFSGTMNDALNFVLEHPTGTLTAYMRVYEPNSAVNFYTVGQNFGTTYTNSTTRKREIDPNLLGKTADYIIAINSSTGNFSERTGEYQVTVNKPTPVALSLNSNNNATMSSYGFNVFTFSGSIEMVVNLAHLGTTLSNNLNLRVYNASGSYEKGTSSAANTFSETGPFQLTGSDTYYVIANGYLDAAGDYTLGFSEMEAPTAVSIASLPEVINNSIDILGDYQYYSFNGTSGDPLTFTLSHPSGLLTAYLYVYQPASDVSFFNLKSGTPYLVSTYTNTTTRTRSTGAKILSDTGKYVIRVHSSTGNEMSRRTGAYQVDIE